MTDQYLPDNVRVAIHDFALQGRELLTGEARDLLEGVYGLKADGTLEPAERLPALVTPETRETYDLLKRFLDDEVAAGLGRGEAVDKLVKEVAFTHLNRLVAFKMMEERKLIRETVRRGLQSNGFKFYLVEHPQDEALLLKGLEDDAYRHFLLWQCAEVAREIAVLFDAENLPSRLFPRPQALTRFLALLNADVLAPAWQAEETIGWVYQFFCEREKSDVFDRLNKKKEKIRREDIPAATQLFTPRWIVRFLVENTVGRLWLQMHPDSHFTHTLEYLVPLPAQGSCAAVRLAKQLTLLDPACGAMHFGLVAFDLCAEMYREELANAGKTGWPATPSVSTEGEIPAAILKYNLFGIDIDLRAVQLSALALYLRAKRMNRNAEIREHNLACADVLPFSGSDLGRFIMEMYLSNPIFERMLRRVRDQLADINQIGSLLRIERDIHDLVDEERRKSMQRQRATKAALGGTLLPGLEGDATERESWEYLEAQLLQALDFFLKNAAQRGEDVRFFAGEATKSLRVLDLMLRRYDCVVANPPYLGRRSMNEILAGFLDSAYRDAKGDLYAAFITRCAELAGDGGRVGMITQQSFMFISSYEKMRMNLLEEFAIETMAHTGPHAFAEVPGEKVNTAAFVLRREPDTLKRENAVGTYFRLVHEPDAEAKRLAFERALAELKVALTT